jgi:hypothetical protein
MRLLRWLPALLVGALAGCASGTRLPAIHAANGLYSVGQVEHAFAAVGLRPLSVSRLTRGPFVALTYGRRRVGPPRIAVVVRGAGPRAATIEHEILQGQKFVQGRNVSIVYQPREATTIQAVLSELQ